MIRRTLRLGRTGRSCVAESNKTGMKAPSTAYKIVDVPELYRDVIARHGLPGTFVGASEAESPWVPFGHNAAIRHLAFDRVTTFTATYSGSSRRASSALTSIAAPW